MPRAEQARRVIDAAIRIVQERGTPQPIGGLPGRLLTYKDDARKIILRTPFNRLPAPSDVVRYFAAVTGSRAENLPNGIDVWIESSGKMQKMLLAEWADLNADMDLRTFKRGTWETDIVDLADSMGRATIQGDNSHGRSEELAAP